MHTFFSKKGFTLVEIMIVVGIIAILSGIFLIGSGTFRNTANVARVKADLQKFESMQEVFYAKNDQYAASINELTGSSGVTTRAGLPENFSGITYHTNADTSCARIPTALQNIIDNDGGTNPALYCIGDRQNDGGLTELEN
jgi:prepilin-type N-terminal cleavage/methylation domain-containing protein